MAEENMKGYSPLYERIVRGVAADRAMVTLASTLPPESHLPLSLLAAVHYLVLDGMEPALGRDLCRTVRCRSGAAVHRGVSRAHWDEIGALLAVRHVQTNESGRSALIVPGLTWLAPQTRVATSSGRRRCECGACAPPGPVSTRLRRPWRHRADRLTGGGHPATWLAESHRLPSTAPTLATHG